MKFYLTICRVYLIKQSKFYYMKVKNKMFLIICRNLFNKTVKMYSKAQIIAASKAVNFEAPGWAGIAPPG